MEQPAQEVSYGLLSAILAAVTALWGALMWLGKYATTSRDKQFAETLEKIEKQWAADRDTWKADKVTMWLQHEEDRKMFAASLKAMTDELVEALRESRQQ